MQTAINDLKVKNQLLRVKIAQASSLSEIEKEAKKLGFVPEKVVFYLLTPLPHSDIFKLWNRK